MHWEGVSYFLNVNFSEFMQTDGHKEDGTEEGVKPSYWPCGQTHRARDNHNTKWRIQTSRVKHTKSQILVFHMSGRSCFTKTGDIESVWDAGNLKVKKTWQISERTGATGSQKNSRDWKMRNIHVLFTVSKSEKMDYLQTSCLFLLSCIASL